MKVSSLFLFLFFYAKLCFSSVIPGNLNHTDRLEILRNLGYGASMKQLTDPYPLGGFSGLELGFNLNSISTKDFVGLGDGTASGRYYMYPSLKIAKGLYDNIDVFGSISIYGANNRVGTYGGMIRWNIFESPDLPVHVSLSLHTMNLNFFNQLTGDTSGLLLNLGLNLRDTSFYLGLGKIKSSASFSGGFSGVTSSGSDEKEAIEDLHIVVGFVRHFDPYFISLEMNRYSLSHVSAAAGIRF